MFDFLFLLRGFYKEERKVFSFLLLSFWFVLMMVVVIDNRSVFTLGCTQVSKLKWTFLKCKLSEIILV